MNSDNDFPPQPYLTQQKLIDSFKSLKLPALFAAIFLISLIVGTGGYLLRSRNTQPVPLSQPSPQLALVTQISATIAQPLLSNPSPSRQAGSTISSPSYTKTYVDTNCGYSFQYPAFVSFKSTGTGPACPGGGQGILLAFKTDPSAPDRPTVLPHEFWMEFDPDLNWKNQTLSDYLQHVEKPDGCCVIDLSTVKQITVNNLRGYVGFVRDLGFQRYYFPLKHNSIFLRINTAQSSEGQLVNEIIGSLQGID
jgi:hypothetical protein